MSIASRILSIEEHIKESYQELEGIGIDTTGVNKNLENIPKLIDGYWETLPKVTGEGTSITLDNTKEGKMKINLKGNTSQETTTGKNKIKTINTQQITNGITFTPVYKNGLIEYINVNGTATDNALYPLGHIGTDIRYDDTLQAGSYLLTDEVGNYTDYFTQFTDGTIYINTGVGSAFTLSEQKNVRTIIFIRSGRTVNNLHFKPMIRLSSVTDDTYEPYTNGASPNPDYPQDVHVVSGDNEIVVCGKNLLKYPYDETTKTTHGITFTDNGDGTIKISGTADANAYFNTYPNTTRKRVKLKAGTYTFSNDVLLPSGITITFSPRDSEGNAISGVSAVYLNNTTKEATRTINQDFEVFSNILVSNGTAITTPITIKQMIEVGSTATTYEAYKGASYPINLGNIELCKIGDYQDSIVKDNGKWYVNKQIGKVVLNGSEQWSRSVRSNGYQFDTGNSGQKKGVNNTLEMYSNYFKGIAFNYRDTINESIYSGNNDNRIRILTNVATQSVDFQSWLSTNKPSVYYILATPTTTEITDSTLISQLEAINGAKSYTTQTNINQENNDNASILNASALSE